MKCLKYLAIFMLLTSFADASKIESRMDFGMMSVGAERSKDMLLTNYTSGVLRGISHSISGEGFRVASDCPAEMRSGLSCRYRITLTCNREGYQTGSLEIYASDKNYLVSLSGYCNPL